MGIDPKTLPVWSDDDLRAAIRLENDAAAHLQAKAMQHLQEAREIAAQLSARHPGKTS